MYIEANGKLPKLHEDPMDFTNKFLVSYFKDDTDGYEVEFISKARNFELDLNDDNFTICDTIEDVVEAIKTDLDKVTTLNLSDLEINEFIELMSEKQDDYALA